MPTFLDTDFEHRVLDAPRPPRRPYIPLGCDQQGRLTPTAAAPAPAEAGTDIGADPHEQRLEAISAGVWWAVLAGLLAWLVVIASLLVVPF